MGREKFLAFPSLALSFPVVFSSRLVSKEASSGSLAPSERERSSRPLLLLLRRPPFEPRSVLARIPEPSRFYGRGAGKMMAADRNDEDEDI